MLNQIGDPHQGLKLELVEPLPVRHHFEQPNDQVVLLADEAQNHEGCLIPAEAFEKLNGHLFPIRCLEPAPQRPQSVLSDQDGDEVLQQLILKFGVLELAAPAAEVQEVLLRPAQRQQLTEDRLRRHLLVLAEIVQQGLH